MSDQSAPICGEHHVSKEWKPTTFDYHEEGVSIQVPNVKAWVCPNDGEASFTPETTDELITTIRELLTPAKRARARRSMPAEYIVKVA
jgi:YgiT-type zinc finger domain-containing protein